MNKKAQLNKAILSNVKANHYFTNPYFQYGTNWYLQDQIEKEIFTFPYNYRLAMFNYFWDKEHLKIYKKHYKPYLMTYFFYDEFYDSYWTCNLPKIFQTIKKIHHQMFYADYLKFIHKQHYHNTWSYCCFIKDELIKKPLPIYSLGELHFPYGCFDVFNIMQESINQVGLPDYTRFSPWFFVFVDLLETHRDLTHKESGLLLIASIFDRFLYEIGVTDDDGNLTLAADKMFRPMNMESLIQGNLRTGKIKLNPNGILPQLMSKLVKCVHLIQPRANSYLHGFNGLALAYGLMQVSHYRRFSYFPDGSKITESPTTYAGCMLIILSRLFGVKSLAPTIQVLDSLMRMDKKLDGSDVEDYKRRVKKVQNEKPRN